MENNLYKSGQSLTGIIIVLIMAILVSAGFYFYLGNGITKIPEITKKLDKESKKIIEKPIIKEKMEKFSNKKDWQTFNIKEYGFSMKIHPDYKKTREEELERGTLKMKVIVFSKNKEKITISIDKSRDVKQSRSDLLRGLKFNSEEWQKSIKNSSITTAEFISKDNIEIGTCLGIQFLEKKNGKYEGNLILTSLNIKNMYVTIFFDYYTEDAKSEIMKMIKTIECKSPF